MSAKPRQADTENGISLSIIGAFFGQIDTNQVHLGWFEYCLGRISDLTERKIELIIVFDDPRWNTLPTAQALRSTFANVKVLTAESEHWNPAQLFNHGFSSSSGQHVLFTSPLHPLNPEAVDLLLETLRNGASQNEILGVVLDDTVTRFGLPQRPSGEILHSWLLNCPLLCLSNVAIPRRHLVEARGFDVSPLLQRSADWDLLIRLAQKQAFKVLASTSLQEAPPGDLATHFPSPVPASDDICRRYLVRKSSSPGNNNEGPIRRQDSFLGDLPEPDRAYLARHIPAIRTIAEASARSAATNAKPLKITVTGGPWEYHHNRLCFFNYLDHLEGTGFATYKSLFDHLTTYDDISESDAVILSRCKVGNVRQILRWCGERGIPSIYMIDDNWLTVAADWPDPYKDVFSPGAPFYENFLFGIKNSDYVLTYNRLLAADLRPYARQILSINNSVALSEFESTPRPYSDRFVVGYAGSPRYADAPFAALGAIGRRRPDVDLLIFGHLLPQQRKHIEGCRVIHHPFVPYERYAMEIRKTGVDILLAPSDDSRTSRSKCPNKYLEITAAGAVGVYSQIEPYTWFVQHDVNGAFVRETDNEASWIAEIENLLNKDRLKGIHAAARADVASSYDVPVVAGQFAKLLDRVCAEQRAAP